jgi:hypothetical protein
MEFKRVLVKQKNPNYLFKQWLQEWIDEANQKGRKIARTYQKALDSLKR